MRLINLEHKAFKNNKAIASLATFMISAFWHGFYPNYYIFFFQFYVLEQVSDILERKLNLFERAEKMNIGVGIIVK